MRTKKQPVKKQRKITKKSTGKPKKALPEFNIHYPQIANQIEFAFECNGVKYYRFAQEMRIPAGRYKWIMNYLREVDMRMSLDMMWSYMKGLRAALDGSKGRINLLDASKIINSIETHLKLEFEPETVKRLASVIYFDETESLDGFDFMHAEKKIQSWNEHIIKQQLKVSKGDKEVSLDFFTTTPIGELLNLNDISTESLLEYINTATQIVKDLTSEQLNQSADNSSGSRTNES